MESALPAKGPIEPRHGWGRATQKARHFQWRSDRDVVGGPPDSNAQLLQGLASLGNILRALDFLYSEDATFKSKLEETIQAFRDEGVYDVQLE